MSLDESARPRSNNIAACALAVLLAVVVLAPYSLSLLRLLTGTAGWLGFVPDYDGVIHVVTPGSPAARAGLVRGDRIDLRATPVSMRRFAVNQLGVALTPGSTVVLAVRHAGTVRTVSLRAGEAPALPPFTAFVQIAQWLGEVAGIVIAFVILAWRPGLLAWTLFLYALSVPAATDQDAFGGLPLAAYMALTLGISDGIGGFGPAALLLFALRFPDDHVAAKLRWAQPLALLFGAVLCGLWLAADLITTFSGHGAKSIQSAYPIVAALAVIATAAALLVRLSDVQGDLRRRVHWLIVAILVLPVVRRIAFFLVAVSPSAYLSVAQPLDIAWVVGELVGWTAIAYAVLRYRVVSLAFVIDRALVYGGLTGGLIAIFAVVEWLVARVFERADLLPAIGLGLALLFAFWFHSLEKQLELLVERVFFAARHRAERRMERSTAMIAFASRVDTIADLLVSEPVDVLSIASAALFLRRSDRQYERIAAAGWPAGTSASLDENDPLVLALRDELTPAPLAELRASPATFPAAAARPSLVVPVVVRRELLGIVLYGAHADGRSLDPDSVASLRSLGAAAGPALVHLMLHRARRNERRLREQLRDVNTAMETLREDVTWLRGCLENGALRDERVPSRIDE